MFSELSKNKSEIKETRENPCEANAAAIYEENQEKAKCVELSNEVAKFC